MSRIRNSKLLGRTWMLLFCVLADCAATSEVERCADTSASELASGTGAFLLSGADDPRWVRLSSAQRLAIVGIDPRVPLIPDFCSGILVSDAVVLTARHCRADSSSVVSFGPDMRSPDFVRSVIARSEHPQSDVVRLELPATSLDHSSIAPEPIALYDGRIDSTWLGTPVQMSGFGVTREGSAHRLRHAGATIVSVGETTLDVRGDDGGACAGDSGGPLLVRGRDGDPRVIGILSKGDASCRGVDRYTRAEVLRSFLDPLSAVEEPSCLD